jgi:hypothetical protein
MVEEKLPQGGTVMEIYRGVTGPLGLSSQDTIELVRNAKDNGFLKIKREVN